VREACVWDVGERGFELTACFITRVEQVPVSNLRYDLPAELEPVDVSVRSLDSNAEATLRDWVLGAEQNGARQLRLDLQGPTSGRLLTVFNCRLKKVATRQPVLRFPRPVLGTVGSPPDVVYALRANALRAKDGATKIDLEALGMTGAIDFDPEKLTRDREWSAVAALRLNASAPLRVLRPTSAAPVELRPTLRREALPSDVTQTTSWQFDLLRAAPAGTIMWHGHAPVSLLEFTLSGPRILEVRGPEVGSWSQSGGRVTVWFRRPLQEGSLDWVGGALPVPAPQGGGLSHVDVGVPHVHDALTVEDRLRLTPLTGCSVQPERDRGWNLQPSGGQEIVLARVTPAAQPLRVQVARDPKSTGQPLTWTRSHQHDVVQASAEPPAELVKKKPFDELKTADVAPTSSPAWAWPVTAAVAWCAALTAVVGMLIRRPASTVPEQVGVLIGMFGAVAFGWWWVGLIGWGALRATHRRQKPVADLQRIEEGQPGGDLTP
jgi:hypothetical protein